MRFQSPVLALSWAALSVAQSTISGANLRIMPLGDSITVGACSSSDNGYRQNLTNLLNGNQVNMIGSSSDGSARDRQFEAHGGYGIVSIQHLAQNSLGSLPNVYLIHAGTNDLAIFPGQALDCAPAGSGGSSDPCQAAANNLDSLLNTLYYTGALLVVAQITPSLNSSYDGRIVQYNKLVAGLVQKRQGSGSTWKIQLVDMYDALNKATDIDPNCGGTNANIVHPTDGGYAKMAQVWYNGIAAGQAQIQAPVSPYGVALRPCNNVYNNASGLNWCGGANLYPSRGKVNFFYGVQCSDASSTTCTCKDSYSGNTNFTVTKTGTCADMSTAYTTSSKWADLNGDGKPENVFIGDNGNLNVSLAVGTPTYFNFFGCGLNYAFRELGIITPGPTTKRYQVRLADIDADNRAEYIIVNPDGSASVYANTGDKHTIDSQISVNFNSNPLTISSMGVPGIGVQFQDFDGDGRTDYVYTAANGTLRVWLNKLQNGAVTWVDQGIVTPPLYGGVIDRINTQIIDINSDGRADYVQFDRSSGAAGVFLNLKPASGNVPNWQFTSIASSTNGTSAGAGGYNDVYFEDVDGDGNADYVVTNAGDSSIQYLRNRCLNVDIS